MIVTATGWTHEQIREMSLGDVLGLLGYWAETPPAHVILAARYLNRGQRSRRENDPAPPPAPRDAEQHEMVALGGFLGSPQPLKPHHRHILDWAETIVNPNPNVPRET